jgi:hypothetical protein
MKICLNCGRNENEVPLVNLSFQGKEVQICPQCLPALIHKPHVLVDKLPGFVPSDVPPHEH